MRDADDCRRVAVWLHSYCGMHYPESKVGLLIQRLNRVVERFELGSLERLADEVEQGANSEIVSAVTHAASTNHTYFYREPQVLVHFRDMILPALANQPKIRVWSAAASTGDEAYTLAMIASDVLGLQAAKSRMSVLGTDISGTVIRHAEAAKYRMASLQNVDPETKERYFCAVDDGRYAVCEDIRRICTFRRMNLQRHPYPFQKRFDVVLCRNVLYYFDRNHQRSVLEAIYDVTEPGGWLLTSVTETVRDLGTRWITITGGVHRRLL